MCEVIVMLRSTHIINCIHSTRNDINVDPFIDLSPMKGMGYSSFMPFSNMMSPPRTVYMPSFLDKQPPPLPPSGTSYHGYVAFYKSSPFPLPSKTTTHSTCISPASLCTFTYLYNLTSPQFLPSTFFL